MKETIIETKNEWSSKENKPKQWQHNLCALFLPISIPLLYIGMFIMELSNFLMIDTHHLEIKLTPKK